MSLADNIKAVRKDRGLTQAAVAEAIGVPTSTISKIERDARAITVEELRALADLLDLATDDIIDYHLTDRPGRAPRPVAIQDAATAEQLRLLEQLDDDDRRAVHHILDQMLTNKRFRQFIDENATQTSAA